MDRLLRNQPGTLTATWERDGVQVDPGTVTVTVTNDAGTNIVTNQGTTGSPGSSRSVVLSASATAQLDSLTVTWTAADGSTLTTYAEIVGGFLFSIQRARTRSPLQDTTAYPTSQLLFYRTLAEMALEDVCGVAFVPRYSRHEASVVNYGVLEVPRRRITSVRSIWTATNSGPQALPTLSGLRILSGSSIFLPTFWNWYSRPVYVGYEHGYQETPPRVSRAALELARRWMVESPWDERATSFRTRDGGDMSIMTASHSDPFDIPEVVAVADVYGLPLVA